MIERFNGRIAEVLATTRFNSAAHLTATIKRYVQVYNQQKNWYKKQPNPFKKRVYDLAGLDIVEERVILNLVLSTARCRPRESLRIRCIEQFVQLWTCLVTPAATSAAIGACRQLAHPTLALQCGQHTA